MTDKGLNRQIMELRNGLTYVDSEFPAKGGVVNYYTVFTPDGKPILSDDVCEIGLWAEWLLHTSVPGCDYEHNLNDAWPLFTELEDGVVGRDIEGKLFIGCGGYGYNFSFRDLADITPEAAARAISELWLQWKRKQR